MRPRRQKESVVTGDRQERQTGHQHTGDRAGPKRQGQAFRQAGARRLGRAHVRPDRHVHADIAGRAGQDGADEKSDADRQVEEQRKDDEDHHADHGNGPVLAIEIGLRALLHSGGDLLHSLAAGGGGKNALRCHDAIDDRKHATGDGQPKLDCHLTSLL